MKSCPDGSLGLCFHPKAISCETKGKMLDVMAGISVRKWLIHVLSWLVMGLARWNAVKDLLLKSKTPAGSPFNEENNSPVSAWRLESETGRRIFSQNQEMSVFVSRGDSVWKRGRTHASLSLVLTFRKRGHMRAISEWWKGCPRAGVRWFPNPRADVNGLRIVIM